jgi:hypothetical protein
MSDLKDAVLKAVDGADGHVSSMDLATRLQVTHNEVVGVIKSLQAIDAQLLGVVRHMCTCCLLVCVRASRLWHSDCQRCVFVVMCTTELCSLACMQASGLAPSLVVVVPLGWAECVVLD